MFHSPGVMLFGSVSIGQFGRCRTQDNRQHLCFHFPEYCYCFLPIPFQTATDLAGKPARASSVFVRRHVGSNDLASGEGWIKSRIKSKITPLPPHPPTYACAGLAVRTHSSSNRIIAATKTRSKGHKSLLSPRH